MNKLPLKDSQLPIPYGVELTRTSLALPDDLPFDDWQRLGTTLKDIEKSVQWWIGDWLNFGERRYGETYAQAVDATDYEAGTLRNAKWVASKVEMSRRRDNLSFSHHQEVAPLEPGEQDEWLDKALGGAWKRSELRKEMKLYEAGPVVIPDGQYRTLVIDPPWPIEMVTKAVRPRQIKMPYPSMTIEDIAELDIPSISYDDSHLYLWTTHKHLWSAYEIMSEWGFKYQCVLTWVKPVGVSPFSWMYSTELVLFGRRGSLDLLKMGVRLDFQGKVREHSRKPDEFYDIVREVSPGPRIDMFSRELRDGFAQFGDEVDKFASVRTEKLAVRLNG